MASAARLRALERAFGELVAPRERATPDLSGYADDPVGFARDVLGVSPWSRQREQLELVRDRPLTVVVGSNGCGKDFATACAILWFAYARGGLVVLTGNTERQVRDVVMYEVRRLYRNAPALRGTADDLQMALRIATDDDGLPRRGVVAFTATDATGAVGWHADPTLFVITEASGENVTQDIWDAAFRVAIGERDRVLATGNPWAPEGPFFEATTRGTWAALRVSALEHPNITGGEPFIPGGPTPAAVERMAAEWGVGDPRYRSAVLGEFALDVEGSFFKLADYEAAVAAWRERRFPARARGTMAFGVDTSITSDRCAVAPVEGDARSGFHAHAVVVWRPREGLAPGATTLDVVLRIVERVEAVARAHGCAVPVKLFRDGPLIAAQPEAIVGRRAVFVVDVNGAGGLDVANRLAERGWSVEHFWPQGAPGNAELKRMFANRRSAAYGHAGLLAQRGRLALPDDPELRAELVNTRFVRSFNKDAAESKADVRRRLGRSPDRADALVMALLFGSDIGSATLGGAVGVSF